MGFSSGPKPEPIDASAMQLDWSDARAGGYRSNARPQAKLAPPAPWWRVVWAQLARRTLSRIERRRARSCFLCGGGDDESLHRHITLDASRIRLPKGTAILPPVQWSES